MCLIAKAKRVCGNWEISRWTTKLNCWQMTVTHWQWTRQSGLGRDKRWPLSLRWAVEQKSSWTCKPVIVLSKQKEKTIHKTKFASLRVSVRWWYCTVHGECGVRWVLNIQLFTDTIVCSPMKLTALMSLIPSLRNTISGRCAGRDITTLCWTAFLGKVHFAYNPQQ